ncbi:MAG: HNH endonuclease signature motif containing protein [Gallionella sp.]|nr:HNH endonuclease signature motif containing protein [Gallionella sp.]
MTKSRNLRPPRTFWTPEQIALLRAHYPDTRTCNLVALIGRPRDSIYAKASELKLMKSDAFMASPASGRTTGKQGTGTRFTKGHQTWNKGLHYQPGGNIRESQFKKGRMPHNWHPIGHERLTEEGYLQRKMADTGVTRRDYRAVHVMLWEQHNGKVPDKHLVIFKDKDKTRIVIENLECISKSENMKRNSFHNYPKEIALLVQLRGALNRKINRQEKQHEQPAN